MENGKHQVLFVTRALWGGGAEKVVHDLAHGLNGGAFQPVVIYLFDQGKDRVPYSPSIPVHPLQSCSNVSPKGDQGDESTDRMIQNAPAPPRVGIRSSALRALCALPGVGTYLSALRGRANRAIGIMQALPKLTRSTVFRICVARFTETGLSFFWLSLRLFFSSWKFREVLHTMPDVRLQAAMLAQILARSPKEALVVPVMEEAAIRVWLSQRFLKRQYIVSLHSYESVNLPLMHPDPRQLQIEKKLFVRACCDARSIVVPSLACRQDLIEHFQIPSNQVRVIFNPLNVQAIREKSKEPLPDLFTDDGKTLFVSVGRLSLDKNHQLLINACSLLKERYDSFRVLCLGDGNMKERLVAEIEAQGLDKYVLLLGHVPNPYPFMRNARALVVTSLAESFSLVLVEAMICGAVPVSVDCPGGPREILDNGQYGMLVPSGDPEALADAMWDIAHDNELFDSFRKVGPRRAEEYDISQIRRQWEKLFEEAQERA